MTRTPIHENPVIHIRFEGRSLEVEARQLPIHDLANDAALKTALATFLNTTPAHLDLYVIDRHENGNLTIRPEAVFG